ncbi:MAG: UDP-N-acetylglucosamine--N-acetylmuramyl-(pentapeptide) pyrophosphoryl-undecaprenol N-acetylglucosamine transferase [Parcubacteria group bacterium]|nr:UDP-N-acetylglucosamine--N-acetylmuramyl-(pentapeptide) pyrophosphoryl-undecaprenol N-acetylglucosamine transferase [Parcubacteria group bacterium]
MKILFTGGGTMGPVTPLLAVHEALSQIDPKVESIWVGTPHGPEGKVVTKQGIQFFSLPVARLPRRISIELLALPVTFARALFGAWRLLRRERPNVVASAGGYTAVPVILAARALKIPIWVHQQDVLPILTNRLTAPFASRVTVAFERTASFSNKSHVIGNPVRPSLLKGDADRARELFEIKNDKPTILVFGGGTGSTWLNDSIDEIALSLVARANVVHLTGIGKRQEKDRHQDHHVREFLGSEMADVLAVADVVVCRAGLGTITELAALEKAAIMIALPHSPQEANATTVERACVVLNQHRTSPEELLLQIEKLLDDSSLRKDLGSKMHAVLRTDIADELAQMLMGIAK